MSPGRPRNGRKAIGRVAIEAGERRQAMLDVISMARSRLVLSLFRCNDYGVLDAIAAALERGVKVEAILTKRAKGGKKSLKKLWEALGEMGAGIAVIQAAVDMGRGDGDQPVGAQEPTHLGQDAHGHGGGLAIRAAGDVAFLRGELEHPDPVPARPSPASLAPWHPLPRSGRGKGPARHAREG